MTALGTAIRCFVRAFAIVACVVGPLAHAQNVGDWWVLHGDDDHVSFLGLGAVYATATIAPSDVVAGDTALLVACDPQSPVGFEVSLFVAPEGDVALDGVVVDILLRPDQGAILERQWFLATGVGYTDAVAFYDDTAELLALLRSASTFALRVQASSTAYAADRTYQFDVRDFAAAIDHLRCARADADTPVVPDGAPAGSAWHVVPGEYASAGTVADGLEEVVVVFCRPGADGVGIDVGAYDAPTLGPSVEVVFRSGSVDFLTTVADLNEYGSYELVDEVAEHRLIRNLRLMTDVTVTLRPVAGGAERRFSLTTSGFSEALAELGCYAAPR